MQMKFYSPLAADFFPNEPDYEAVGIEMSDAYFRRSAERLKTALAADENAE